MKSFIENVLIAVRVWVNRKFDALETLVEDMSFVVASHINELTNGKQNKLTVGDNIAITDDTISAVDTTYSAGTNVSITENNINALGYTWNGTLKSFSEGDTSVASGKSSHAEGISTVTQNDGEHAEGKYNKTNQIVDDSEFVDLGLPSGTYWCKHNLGAATEESLGYMLAWAEKTPRTVDYTNGTCTPPCDWDHYQWGTQTAITKYNGTDHYEQLLPEDDAVTEFYGDGYYTPGRFEFNELINPNYTYQEWGRNGVKIINKKDPTKYIFLPFGGMCYDGVWDFYDWGYYWTRDMIPNNYYDEGYCFNFGRETFFPDIDMLRSCAAQIRPVTSVPQQEKRECFTIHSVGIGESENKRKNAVETMRNGDVYVYRIGNYYGSNPEDAKTLQAVIADLDARLSALEVTPVD